MSWHQLHLLLECRKLGVLSTLISRKKYHSEQPKFGDRVKILQLYGGKNSYGVGTRKSFSLWRVKYTFVNLFFAVSLSKEEEANDSKTAEIKSI